ncbi:hypothetical protein ACLOJK_028703 [Asimina triloba]
MGLASQTTWMNCHGDSPNCFAGGVEDGATEISSWLVYFDLGIAAWSDGDGRCCWLDHRSGMVEKKADATAVCYLLQMGSSSPSPESVGDGTGFLKGRETRRSLLLEKMGGDAITAGSRRRNRLRSTQIYPPCLVANLFDDSDQPSEMSPTMGSEATMSKMMAHCLDAPLVAAVILPRIDRPIGGSPHAWLPLIVMEHHISVLRQCTEV